MKSDNDNVLGKGIEAIFKRTAHLMKEHGKTLELPNGVICREGDDLIIRLRLGESEDIRSALAELSKMAGEGMLDPLMDETRVKTQVSEHLEMALMAIEEGDYPAAISELEMSLKKQNNTDIRYNLALILDMQGEIEKAVKQYRLVIKLNPNDVEALNNLGRLFYDKGDFTRAMEVFEKAVKIRPDISKGTRAGLFPPRFGFRKIG
jgi:tetratricopeptide (TPR) repeat protein